MPDNGRVIVISDSDAELARVISREEGFTVKDQKIRIDDLLNALMSMVEPSELTKLIMKNDDSVMEVVEPAFDLLRGKGFTTVIGKLVEKAKGTNDMSLIVDLFKVVAERFDLSSLDEESLNGFLRHILQRLEGINKDEVIADLFLSLLARVNLAGSREEELIGGVLRELRDLKSGEAKEFFRDVAADFVPNVKTVCTPILPKGTVLYQEDASGTKVVVLERDRARRDVTFHNTPYNQVGHPKLLFAFLVKHDEIKACQIVAIKDVTIKPNSRLFRYPFSNVYSDNRACWPELASIKIKNLYELQNLPDLFFNSPANNHLFQGENLREWFFTLQNKDFDDSKLVPLNTTVEKFYEMFNSATQALSSGQYDQDGSVEERVVVRNGGLQITA